MLDEIRAAYGLTKRDVARASRRSEWAVGRSMRKPLHRVTLGELLALCTAIRQAPVKVLPLLRRIPRGDTPTPPPSPDRRSPWHSGVSRSTTCPYCGSGVG